MRSAIVFINGFRQGIGPCVGLQKLYQNSTRCWYDRRQDLLLHRTWKANHAETADLIVSHDPELIYVVGYSYGCGRGLTRLAKHLAQRDRNIDTAFLIDPVTRYRILKPLSLGWWGRKSVSYETPPNIDEVFSWRQVNHQGPLDPVGHRVLTQVHTVAHPQVVMGRPENLRKYGGDDAPEMWRIDYDVNHSTIDNHPAVHREILNILTQRNSPPPQENTL